MAEKQEVPYGSWKSPVTADLIVSGVVQLGELQADGPDLYWTEGRPTEGGRYVLVRYNPAMGNEELTPPPLNVRTRVHEYGGGSYAARDREIIFANYADQGLYRQSDGGEPQAVTPPAAVRYADGVFAADGRFICVREDHRREGAEPANAIVALRLDGQDVGEVLAEGNDFYASPRLSPDGRRLAYLTWNHPNMPWDGTELWLADLLPDAGPANPQRVAGGPEESIFQPEWSPDGRLYYVSDRTGWWNLYRWDGGAGQPLYPLEAEFGAPLWRFGARTYAFRNEHELLCAVTDEGIVSFMRLDLASGQLTELGLPFTVVTNVQVAGDRAYFLGAAPDLPLSVIALDLNDNGYEILGSSCFVAIDSDYIVAPQAIEFPTAGGRSAHAFFYPPRNPDFRAPAEERPPLVVMSHGGPTGMTYAQFSPEKLFWTSRGFAVLDVNYGGSAGFGRAYRQRLNGQWGVVDVEDCLNGARYLAREGLVDGERLVIRGGSAGGYTTLCALTFHDDFRAGASYFGVSDAAALTRDTHKFESRYLDNLIGPYPEAEALYAERSPLHHAEQISCPLILLQGLEDRVVPPDQAEKMFAAVKEKGLPVAYLPFEGEQHGFRQAANMKRALEAEYYFYAQVLDLAPADDIPPVRIENLPAA